MRFLDLRSRVALLLLTATAVVAVACGGETIVKETVLVPGAEVTVVVPGDTVEVVVTATPLLPPTATPLPAAKQAPPSKNPTGELVWAIQDNQSNWGGYNSANLCCGAKMMSVVETLFKPTHEGGPATALLAESWQLDTASPPKYVDVTLRSGVEFHGGFGELTADDLVWSVNDTNPNLSTELGAGQPSVTDGSGTWAGFLGANPAEKTGTYTARINWESFDPRWDTWFFGQDGLGAGIVSKNAFDQNGKDWNLDHVVGTGPYELTTWTRGERTVYSALQSHWRKVAEVQEITRLTVPDETVRLAMLETGEADIAEVGLSNIPQAQRVGMVTAGSGTARMVSVMFAGNLWETTHPTTGDDLEIVTYNNDLAWLGNPHSPDDSNNPPGMDDMEQARLVRTALSMAIDRELINEAVLNGLGWPVHIPYFDINNDNWQGKWEVPFDPDGAEALLDQAGFPRNSSGTRFTIPMFAWPIGHFFADIGDAVSIQWEDIGVKVDVLHYEYPVFRPTLVGRSATQAWTDTGPLEAFSSTPWDWPRGIQMSALARGGKSHGLENPTATANYLNVSAESDLEARIALNNQFADFLREWVPGMGVVAAPSLIAYNPNSIAEWDMELGLRQATNSPENITIR